MENIKKPEARISKLIQVRVTRTVLDALERRVLPDFFNNIG